MRRPFGMVWRALLVLRVVAPARAALAQAIEDQLPVTVVCGSKPGPSAFGRT